MQRSESGLICHINLARMPRLGGGERQTEILVQELAAQGVLRQRVVVHRRGVLAARFQSTPYLEVRRVSNRLSALFACRGACLLHAHDGHATLVAYVASWFGARYLITRRIMKPIRRFSCIRYRKAQTVVTLTQAIEDVLRSCVPEVSAVQIPSAWTQGTIDPAVAKKLRARFHGKFIVGHIARMDGPGKGHRVLLQAARTLGQQLPDILFLLCGDGRLGQEFRQQGKDLKNVYFAGWVENPLSWIEAFDLFAFPSLKEGLGSILLDVMRAGVPIVASRAGGIPGVVTQDCGVLVAPDNSDALVEQLVRLYRSSSLRRRLSAGGVVQAVKYSPAQMAKSYLEIYRSIVGGLV